MRPFRSGSHRLVETSGAPHWRPLALSLALAASSLALAISPAAATYPGASNGRLAFAIKDAGGNAQINTVMPDGTDVKTLTSGAHFHACAAYSADGSKIAYCSDESGTFEIWTMNADGSDQAQLTTIGGFATFPDFSPDGTTVTFTGTAGPDSEATEVRTVDTATGETVTALTSCPTDTPGCNNGFPAWSPDGTQIAYIHVDDTVNDTPVGSQVWVMDADGSNAHALTTDDAIKDQLPDWSPDGTQIAYHSGPGGSGGIWVMNADGSDQHQLLGCAAEDPTPCATGDYGGPTWSPDGQEIAFLSFPADPNDRPVMIMNADGSNPHRVIAGPSIDFVPAWQPLMPTVASSSSASAGSLAPEWVTGTIVFGPCNSSPSDTTEPGVTHNHDFLCEPAPITSSNSRLAGTYVQRWNEDIYEVAGPQMVISAGTYDVQNADGSWHCSWDASYINNMFPPPPGATVTISCVGAGANQGLSAILVLDESTVGKVAPFTGVVFPGDVPPVP